MYISKSLFKLFNCSKYLFFALITRNYDTNRNNMHENLLLYGRLSLQLVYC